MAKWNANRGERVMGLLAEGRRDLSKNRGANEISIYL
jgi:hypothetical protein